MRLKTFHAETTEDAMAEVRRVLGDDAIIVSTVHGRRGRGVQVTAAIDPQAAITDLPPAAAPTPAADDVARILAFHRTPSRVAERLSFGAAAFAGEEPTLRLGAALDLAFAFAPLPAASRRPLMLVGAPGAGKTVTAAKLAARAALAGATPALITTDTVRAGGVEQLKTFADAIGCGFAVADEPLAMADAIAAQTGADLIVIDTPGLDALNPSERSDLAGYLAAADIEPVLVQAGGTDAEDAADAAVELASLGVRRFVATRLDISRRLGAMLAAADAGRLAISDVGATPFIACGLTTINPLSLARLLTVTGEPALRQTDQPDCLPTGTTRS